MLWIRPNRVPPQAVLGQARGIAAMHAWRWLLVVTARDLIAGDVITVLGEQLTVTGPPKVDGTTAVIPTTGSGERVTLYLRAAGPIALVRPSPARSATTRPTLVPAPPAVVEPPPTSTRTAGRRAAS